MSARAKNLARRLRDLKDEHTDVLDRRSVYSHDVNRAVVALRSYGREKERIEAQRPTNQAQQHGQQHTSQDEQEPPSQPDVDKAVEQEAEETVSARPEAPPWAKKAYRKIVQLTHPDKVNMDPEITDAQRDRLCALYQEAVDAFREAKWSELLEVAAELDIEVDADQKMMEEALESKIKELTDSISKIQGTIAWAWGNSFGDLSKRVNILNRCCEVMGIIPPPRPALEEIVRELEGNLEFDIVDRLGHVKRLKVEATKRKIGSRPQKRLR
jgi:hypothetical protein